MKLNLIRFDQTTSLLLSRQLKTLRLDLICGLFFHLSLALL